MKFKGLLVFAGIGLAIILLASAVVAKQDKNAKQAASPNAVLVKSDTILVTKVNTDPKAVKSDTVLSSTPDALPDPTPEEKAPTPEAQPKS